MMMNFMIYDECVWRIYVVRTLNYGKKDFLAGALTT
jgi:hypothetical protein